MDLLDKIHAQKHELPDYLIEREICKKNIRTINNKLKNAVASGNARKTLFLLDSLEQAILELQSTYILK